MQDTRIHNRWPMASEGLPFVAGAGALAVVFYLLDWDPLAFLFLAIALFIAYFFRDPERIPPGVDGAVVAPADGKILEVRSLGASESPLKEDSAKISIFMSLFDVHVNRIPFGGSIEKIEYRPGKFFSADLDKSSLLNESNRILLNIGEGRNILLVQIAGLVARRICCWVQENQEVQRGQRFGLIRFGSRVELLLPKGFRPAVAPGQRVKAGITILGFLE